MLTPVESLLFYVIFFETAFQAVVTPQILYWLGCKHNSLWELVPQWQEGWDTGDSPPFP